ncbi:hypothetical protein B0H16DRAFT_1503783 [Mycena metata]|uniref:Uncharacterized protein n=1 Tax=Mycena metata TaxID=1033252 RepID=A0AAD7K507_9AGAR|nr:hypothetical protein B0H16DRAFT_1503783 [Mycena metata]
MKSKSGFSWALLLAQSSANATLRHIYAPQIQIMSSLIRRSSSAHSPYRVRGARDKPSPRSSDIPLKDLSNSLLSRSQQPAARFKSD